MAPQTPIQAAETTRAVLGGPNITASTSLSSSATKFNMRAPIKHASASALEIFQPPPLEWLQGAWAVTHSTLPMWKKAKNVTITYTVLPGGLLDDVVQNTPTQKSLLSMSTIKGVDHPLDRDGKNVQEGVGAAQWEWRGRGWLKIAGRSRWEVLGWGERDQERWVVTWFAASLFTPPGIDVYCDRKNGISKELFAEIKRALEQLGVREVNELAREMFPIAID